MNLVTGTVNEDEDDGILNAVTDGAVVSAAYAAVARLNIRMISIIPKLIFFFMAFPFFSCVTLTFLLIIFVLSSHLKKSNDALFLEYPRKMKKQ